MLRERIEDVRSLDDLLLLVEELGYRGPWGQLQVPNGAFVSSLVDFLEDNPGAIEALTGWIAEHGFYREGQRACVDEAEVEEDDGQ